MGRTVAAVIAALLLGGCTSGEPLPDLVGLQVGEAIDLLERREIDYVVRDDETSDALAGEVVATQPQAGDTVEEGTVVVLSVAVEPWDDEFAFEPPPDEDFDPEPSEPEAAPAEPDITFDDFEIVTAGFGRSGVGFARAGALVRYAGPEPLSGVIFSYTLRDDNGRAVATFDEIHPYLFPERTYVLSATVLYDSEDRPTSIEVEPVSFSGVPETAVEPEFEFTGLELRGDVIVGEIRNLTDERRRAEISCGALDAAGQLLAASSDFRDAVDPDRTAAVDVLLSEVDNAAEVVCSAWDRDLW